MSCQNDSSESLSWIAAISLNVLPKLGVLLSDQHLGRPIREYWTVGPKVQNLVFVQFDRCQVPFVRNIHGMRLDVIGLLVSLSPAGRVEDAVGICRRELHRHSEICGGPIRHGGMSTEQSRRLIRWI
jgi:hypothetical protein